MSKSSKPGKKKSGGGSGGGRGGGRKPASPPASDQATWEIIPEAEPWPYLPKLKADLRREYELVADPDGLELQERIQKAEKILGAHPELPEIYELLVRLYFQAQRLKDWQALVHDMYDFFPDCLFAHLHQAHVHLHEGRLQEIPTVLEGMFTIEDFRKTHNPVHFRDIVLFLGVLGQFHAQAGERTTAETCLAYLQDLDPFHVHTLLLAHQLNPRDTLH